MSLKWLQKKRKKILQDMQDNKCDNGDHELHNSVGQCARKIKKVLSTILIYVGEKKKEKRPGVW
jgi:hypothetical protein